MEAYCGWACDTCCSSTASNVARSCKLAAFTYSQEDCNSGNNLVCTKTPRRKKEPYFGKLFWSREASMGKSRRLIILIVQFFNEKRFYQSSSKYLILFVCLIMCPTENNCVMVFFVLSTALQFCIHWIFVVVLWQHDNEDKRLAQ